MHADVAQVCAVAPVHTKIKEATLRPLTIRHLEILTLILHATKRIHPWQKSAQTLSISIDDGKHLLSLLDLMLSKYHPSRVNPLQKSPWLHPQPHFTRMSVFWSR